MYNDKERKKAEGLVHKMVKRAVELEGTVTVSFGLFGCGIAGCVTDFYRASTVLVL